MVQRIRDDGTTEVRIARIRTVEPALASGERFDSLERGPINDLGQVAFAANTSAANAADGGIFRSAGSPGQVVAVVREGASAPGNGNFIIRPNSAIGINATGQVAFAAELFNTTGGSNDDAGIYRFDNASSPLVQIVRKGDDVPEGNGRFNPSNNFVEPSLNNAGEVAFVSTVSGSGVIGDSGIYRGNGATITNIGREGDAAPGGGTFDGFGLPALNNSGQLAFFGSLGSGADGVYRSDGSTTTQIVREGQLVPDGSGNTFRQVQTRVAINDAGQVAFASTTVNTASGASPDGIFRGNGSTITIAATTGQFTPSGDIFTRIGRYAMNELGQIAFTASSDPDGPDFSSFDDIPGLYFYDDTLGVLEIARRGDALLGSTIASIAFAGSTTPSNNSNGNASPEATGLNDLGQVAFQFELADGRKGIVITSLMATLLGDYSGNGTVDAADYTVWQDNFGSTTMLAADGNGNGIIDAADYTVWQDNFGATSVAAFGLTNIPEPGTLALLSLGFPALMRRRAAVR